MAIAAPLGKELFLYHQNAGNFGVYSLAKHEWSVAKRFWVGGFELLVFTTNGKFYSFSESMIDVYDGWQNSWTSCHTHSFIALRPDDAVEFLP